MENITNREALKQRFVTDTLRKEATNIITAQSSKMQQQSFNSSDWFNHRPIMVNDNTVTLNFLKKMRFVDMKSLRGVPKKRQNRHEIYNSIVWGHYNNIVKELSFGFTEAAQQSIIDNLQM